MNDVVVRTLKNTTTAPPFIVSLFSSKTDSTPVACDYPDFSDLARDLIDLGHDIRQDKDGYAISAAEYGPNAKRGNAHVARVHALFLDFDKLAEQQMKDVLEALKGFEYLIYTTFSDQPGTRCFRILLPIAEPISPAEYASYWNTINDLTGGLVDPATKDVSRISYLPSCPPGAQGHFIGYHCGLIGGTP